MRPVATGASAACFCRVGGKSEFLQAEPVRRRVRDAAGVVFARLLPGLLCRVTAAYVRRRRAEHPAAAVSPVAESSSDSAPSTFRRQCSPRAAR